MEQPIRRLSAANIDSILGQFVKELSAIGTSVAGKTGIDFCLALKRDRLEHGPYKGVSLLEASNRIMSDLVILYGVKGLLKAQPFPAYDEYLMEFGNEDRNGFDLRAEAVDGTTLIGEAFNAAPSFFQLKKSAATRKLRSAAVSPAHRVLVYNDDACAQGYAPRNSADGVFHVLVDVHAGTVRVIFP